MLNKKTYFLCMLVCANICTYVWGNEVSADLNIQRLEYVKIPENIYQLLCVFNNDPQQKELFELSDGAHITSYAVAYQMVHKAIDFLALKNESIDPDDYAEALALLTDYSKSLEMLSPYMEVENDHNLQQTRFVSNNLAVLGNSDIGGSLGVTGNASIGGDLTINGTVNGQLLTFPLTVSQGGTGDTSFTANEIIAGGATSTSALQSVPNATAGYVLTSTGATSLPIFAPLGSLDAWVIEGNVLTTPGNLGTITNQGFNVVANSVPVMQIPASGDIILGSVNTGVTTTLQSGSGGLTINFNSGPLIINGQTFAFPLTVSQGGTGDTSFTTYAPICGGTTGTGILQSASTGIATVGYILTSTGSGSLPTWQAPAASSITVDGNSGSTLTGNSFTFSGGTTGLTFNGTTSPNKETLNGTLVVSNGGTGGASFTANEIIAGGTTSTSALQSVPNATAGYVLASTGTGSLPAFSSLAALNAWVTGGNALTASGTLGTTTAQGFNVVADNVTVMQIPASGDIILGSANTGLTTTLQSGSGGLTINSNTGPLTIEANGGAGNVTIDANLIVDGTSELTGNVGIGIAPQGSNNLYVNGTSFFNGFVGGTGPDGLVEAGFAAYGMAVFSQISGSGQVLSNGAVVNFSNLLSNNLNITQSSSDPFTALILANPGVYVIEWNLIIYNNNGTPVGAGIAVGVEVNGTIDNTSEYGVYIYAGDPGAQVVGQHIFRTTSANSSVQLNTLTVPGSGTANACSIATASQLGTGYAVNTAVMAIYRVA